MKIKQNVKTNYPVFLFSLTQNFKNFLRNMNGKVMRLFCLVESRSQDTTKNAGVHSV